MNKLILCGLFFSIAGFTQVRVTATSMSTADLLCSVRIVNESSKALTSVQVGWSMNGGPVHLTASRNVVVRPGAQEDLRDFGVTFENAAKNGGGTIRAVIVRADFEDGRGGARRVR